MDDIPVKTEVDDAQAKRLRILNLVAGVFHLVQAIILTALTSINDFDLPVTTSFLHDDRVRTKLVGQVRLGYLVAIFSWLSAIFHFIIIAPFIFDKYYIEGLKRNINQFRWYEYALSSSFMIWVIAMLTGFFDIGGLILIFSLNACMNLFGLAHEKYNQQRETVDWTFFIHGCFAGAIPWVVIFTYFTGAVVNSEDGGPPDFVWGIMISIFIFFNTFPINMILQYKRIGPWGRSYLFGEQGYIVLSFVAKTLLAWQVWGGTAGDDRDADI